MHLPSRSSPALRRRLCAVVLAFVLVSLARSAQAQVCSLENLPPFAGHHFPLVAEVGAVVVSQPFPNLGLGGTALVFLTAEPLPPSPDPGGIDRLYVLDRAGRVLRFENRSEITNAEVETFLDLTSRIAPIEGEAGLLGMAFDPDFWSNGYFYVMYSRAAVDCAQQPAGLLKCNVIERYQASGDPPVVTVSATSIAAPPILKLCIRSANEKGAGCA